MRSSLLAWAFLLAPLGTLPAQVMEDRIAACNNGNASACRDAGAQLELRGDYVRAAGFHQQACDARQGVACAALARLYVGDLIKRRDPSRAMQLYQLACDYEYAVGCTILGGWLEQGTPVSADLPRSARLYRRGCDLGDGVA